MAKTMAQIKDTVVIYLLWCSNSQEETEDLKDIGDRLINIGDIYQNGKWYNPEGQEIFTHLEITQQENDRLQKENEALAEANNKLTTENQQAKAANEELLNNLNVMKLNQEQTYQEGVNSI